MRPRIYIALHAAGALGGCPSYAVLPPHRVFIDLFEDGTQSNRRVSSWSINRIRNWDADGNRLMHTIDNIELVLSALNSMERKGATTTFMGGATIFHFPDTGLTHASKKGATTG